ncbi:MAG: hypothetical protein JNM07_04955 [Phycisphaerae bacterium]|nr:hypothetical protein [Phycisphaerae bacterium]
MEIGPATNPLRVAAPARARPQQEVRPSAPTLPFTLRRTYGVDGARAAGVQGRTGASGIRGLAAGVVAGGIDFQAQPQAAPSGALVFYRHPADRNSAATSIEVGRGLDVTG